MIIDVILDRRGGVEYNAEQTADYIKREVRVFEMDYQIGENILLGDEKKAKAELCRYIDEQGYNPSIKDYINSVTWCDMSMTDKIAYVKDYVINSCYCIWELFLENLNSIYGNRPTSTSELYRRLTYCKSQQDIRKFVGEII